MTTYRSVGYVHACPQGGCDMCKNEYAPPPANPRNYPGCCQYYENGEAVQVVIYDPAIPLMTKPKRPSTRGRATATRSMTLEPQPRRKPATAKKKRAAKKPAPKRKLRR